MAVRSRPFYAGRTTPRTAGYFTAYTVPTDRTAILKQVSVTNQSGGNVTIAVWANPGSGVVFLYVQTVLAAGAQLQWQPWMPFEEGDTFGIYSTSDVVDTYLGGALLSGDPS